jgi:4'-phosphopantetheinyl transferase
MEMASAMAAHQWPWNQAPRNPALSQDEVHIWRAALDRSEGEVQELWRLLAPDEQERAARFHFARDRERFVAGRGILRAILARYLDADPAGLAFRYGAYGKPALAIEDGDTPQFNLAHSQGLAVYALARGRAIGVDIERVRALADAEQIAERFFSLTEQAALRAVPTGQRLEAFFACWTRKEAFLKATGDGLARPLDQFDVALAPEEPARLLHVVGEPEAPARWRLEALAPALGYVAAVAATGHDWRLACWAWRE